MLHSLHLAPLAPMTLAGIVALTGLYMGSFVKRFRLPSLIGYMLLGVLLGPSLLNLLGEQAIEHLSFITQMALGFVAFSIGAELNLSTLKSLGSGIVFIIFAESLAAFFVVLFLVYLFSRDLPLSLIFAAMAPASAPAGTVAVIQEYRAKGKLTQALYAVVGFDDGLAIIIFGFAAALARSLLVGEATGEAESFLPAMVAPFKEIALSAAIGLALGFLFSMLAQRLKSTKEILILVFGVVMIGVGLSERWHLSLILTNMVCGMLFVNMRRKELVKRVTEPLLETMPLLFVLFFSLAGAHLKLELLPSLGLLGLVYIAGRTMGLLGGARLGASLGHVDPKVKKYLGMGILSQAGVAIGLSLIISQDFGVLAADLNVAHPVEIGAKVLTTITATCIFFEIIGPILTKIALEKAGEIQAHKQA